MRSGRPGMEPGTPQNDDVNRMIDGLKSTLILAAAGPVIDGVGAIVGGSVDLGGALGSVFKNCFVAGTPVQMADGATKPIEQVKAGDRVMSRNPDTGETEAKKVVRTFRNSAPTMLTVQFADAVTGKVVQTLTATPGHPFFVPGRGPVPLGDLGIGTQVVTRAGPPLVIASLVRHSEPQGTPIFNFEVEGDHTYFVGTAYGGVWVHNTSPKPRLAFPPVPGVPAGMNTNQFGSGLIGWGTGYDAAIGRIGNINLAELEAKGVTLEMAEQWLNFYKGVVAVQPNNGSAAGRIELMQHIVDLFNAAHGQGMKPLVLK